MSNALAASVVPANGVEGRYIRGWSGADCMEWEDALSEFRLPNGRVATGTLKAVCLVLSLSDASGRRLFAGRSDKDLRACMNSLTRQEAAAAFQQACEVNGVLTATDPVEVAEGN